MIVLLLSFLVSTLSLAEEYKVAQVKSFCQSKMSLSSSQQWQFEGLYFHEQVIREDKHYQDLSSIVCMYQHLTSSDYNKLFLTLPASGAAAYFSLARVDHVGYVLSKSVALKLSELNQHSIETASSVPDHLSEPLLDISDRNSFNIDALRSFSAVYQKHNLLDVQDSSLTKEL